MVLYEFIEKLNHWLKDEGHPYILVEGKTVDEMDNIIDRLVAVTDSKTGAPIRVTYESDITEENIYELINQLINESK